MGRDGAVQFNNVNLFTGHDRKWARSFIFVVVVIFFFIFFSCGKILGGDFMIREKKKCGFYFWHSASWEPLFLEQHVINKHWTKIRENHLHPSSPLHSTCIVTVLPSQGRYILTIMIMLIVKRKRRKKTQNKTFTDIIINSCWKKNQSTRRMLNAIPRKRPLNNKATRVDSPSHREREIVHLVNNTHLRTLQYCSSHCVMQEHREFLPHWS